MRSEVNGAAQRLTGITLRHIRRGRGGAEENKPISVFGSDIVLQALLQLQVATTGRARRTGAAVRRPATGVRGIGDAAGQPPSRPRARWDPDRFRAPASAGWRWSSALWRMTSLEELAAGYQTQAEELRKCSRQFREAGLLAKHQQAEEMLVPIKQMIAKMAAMGYGTNISVAESTPAKAAAPTRDSPTSKEGGLVTLEQFKVGTPISADRAVWCLDVPTPAAASAAEVEVELLGRSRIEVSCAGEKARGYDLPAGLDTESMRVKFSKKSRSLAIQIRHRPRERLAVACAEQLRTRMFAFVDGFLGDDSAEALRSWVHGQRSQGALGAGEMEGGRQASARGDEMAWVSAKETGGPLLEYATRLDDLILQMTEHCPELAGAHLMRDKAMVTCYPGGSTRYVRHVDNANNANRTRVLTTIVYLNPDWEEAHGGQLRLHAKGGGYHDIAPRHDRLAMFWSDFRTPHEVLPTLADRFAVSFWYHNGQTLRAEAAG
eukprot:jgi/Tetstr1/445455/TSEL_033234.t1